MKKTPSVEDRLKKALDRAMKRMSSETININDGKHHLIVAEDGERVLTPKQNQKYEKEHPHARKKPMQAMVYDEGGDVEYGVPSVDIGFKRRTASTEPEGRPEFVNWNALERAGRARIQRAVNEGLGKIDIKPVKLFDDGGVVDEKDLPAVSDERKGALGRIEIPEDDSQLKPLSYSEGAPVDFGGPVYPNRAGARVQADTDQPLIRDENTATMDTRNARPGMARIQNIPNAVSDQLIPVSSQQRGFGEGAPVTRSTIPDQVIEEHRDNADALQDQGAKKGDLTKVGLGQILHNQIDKAEARNVEPYPYVKGAGPLMVPEAPSVTGLPVIGAARQAAEEKAIIPTATPQTPKQAYEYQKAELDKRIEAARNAAVDEKSSPEDRAAAQTLADRLALRREELKRPAATTLLGKIGRGFERAGNIAGDVFAPGTMALIPGTELHKSMERAGTLGQIQSDIEREKDIAAAEAARDKTDKKDYELKQDDQGRMWRVSKSGAYPAQIVSFDAAGQPILSAPPTGAVAPAAGQPTFGSEKGVNAPAKPEQVEQYAAQLPMITRHLKSEDREAFSFPKGYTPTVKEIQDMKAMASKAEADEVAGRREDRAAAAALAAANKRTMEENLIENIAKDIAPMDVNSLSQLKNITSMRSDQRAMIYARAREINPKFNTSEVDRKVKMLDNYTNGSEGKQLQSFGTFLEHAGNAVDVTNELRSRGQFKILNTPVNKLEKEFGGTTANEIAAVLEPVRKEAESFLLGGRALYADDRKAAETILNDASSPAQIEAAITRLSHVVGARYNEMDNRFKNQMGASIADTIGPLSPEAQAVADRFDIFGKNAKKTTAGTPPSKSTEAPVNKTSTLPSTGSAATRPDGSQYPEGTVQRDSKGNIVRTVRNGKWQ